MNAKKKPSETPGNIIGPNRRYAGSSNYSDDNQVGSGYPSFIPIL
jgi:hypothetical protein